MKKYFVMLLLFSFLPGAAFAARPTCVKILTTASAALDSTGVGSCGTDQITNNCAKAIFIPNKTVSEWNSYTAHAPACAPYTLAGACPGVVNPTACP